MKRAFLKSLLIHGLFFFAMVAPLIFGGAGGTGVKESGSKNGGGSPPEEAEVVIVPKTTQPEDKGDKCQNWYGGVGILVGYAMDERGYTVATINDVVEGYPAYRAGLRVGDIITNDPDLKGEVGTAVIANIFRNGQTMSFTMIREKVCIDGKDQ